MHKKIIVLSIASALTMPSLASADTENVNVYGQANVSFDMVNTGGSAGVRTHQVSSNASYLGFRGSEELGNGWTGVWQIEQQINIDNSAVNSGVASNQGNTFGTRNTFVSLFSGEYGIFALGRYNTPYKIATRSMDVFADTIADNRSLMGGASLNLGNLTGTSAGAAFDGNQGDVAAYIAPAFGDFTLAAAYVAGAEAATTSGQVKGHAQSYAVLYSHGPLSTNMGYEIHNLGSDNTGTLNPQAGLGLAGLREQAWKVGASYVIDSIVVYGVYERTSDNLGAVLGKPARTDYFGHRSYYLAGKYKFGSDTVKVAYTNAGDLDMNGAGSNTGAKQWTLGYDHSLSRRTSLYALYSKLDNDANATFNMSTAQGSTGYANASAAGADTSAFSLGMKHRF